MKAKCLLRLLSLLLVAATLVLMLPLTAMPALAVESVPEETPDGGNAENTSSASSSGVAPVNNFTTEDEVTTPLIHTGTCGENLKWEIDSLEDILIISGYGEMTDWEKPEDAPWFEYSDEFVEKWCFIYNAREAANKALEEARNAKTIGKSLEAKVIIKADADYDRFAELAQQLTEVLIVSDVIAEKAEGETTFTVEAADGEKCERCWCYSTTVGTDCNHPTLCKRCAVAIEL